MADEGRFGLPKLDVKPYAKWAVPNTSTKDNDPANEVNRAKGEPNKQAPGVSFHGDEKTINDGTTDVVVSHLNKPKVPGQVSFGPEKQHYPPCINPTCKSFGKSHPNCLCYAGPGGSSLEQGHFAKGGCVGPHKEDCEHFANGGQIEEQHRILHDPQETLDHIGLQHGLLHLLTKTGHNGRSENPHKHFEAYVDASKHGHKTLDHHVKNLIGSKKLDVGSQDTEALKSHLDDLQANPEKALDVGDQLGSVLPMHGAVLAAKTATAMNYLQAIKPKSFQGAPLDPVTQPSRLAQANYDRQVGIAQNPSLVLKHAKQGTLQPQDLQTLHTLYPSLAKNLQNKTGEALINAKVDNTHIPREQKQGLSSLLGQPMDSIQTPMAMQAIMKANMPTQAPQGQKPKKASGKELDQISKTEDLLATPSQTRLMDKKQ